jgi:hypothetical protein
MFSVPKFQFPGKLVTVESSDGSVTSDLLLPGDLLTDSVTVWGSRYRTYDYILQYKNYLLPLCKMFCTSIDELLLNTVTIHGTVPTA